MNFPKDFKSPFQIIGKRKSEIRDRIQSCIHSLFYGDVENERICFGDRQFRYIVDIGHSDIRSEGMSYGMFIAAELGLEPLFQSLWNFSKKFLRNSRGDFAPYFAWQVGIRQNPTGFYKMDPGAAPDGEEYFAAALLVAAQKFNRPEYRREAIALLRQMAYRKPSEKLQSMFHPRNFLVRFSPIQGNEFTNPSYHTLAFYRLFAKETKDPFWESVYRESLAFLARASHPETGLFPDYAEFDGSPKHTEFFPTSECFSGDAWRVALNLAMDFNWEVPGVCESERERARTFERDSIRKWLRFFCAHRPSLADYRIDGSAYPKEARPITPGLVAMNAAATAALDLTSSEDIELSRPFLARFWTTPIPTGTWRYYDGMLYMLGLLVLGGESQEHGIS